MGKFHFIDELAKIFVDEFKKKNKSKFKSIITNPLADNKVRIRFIDANHCPGAAIILITGPFGNVLQIFYFRYGGGQWDQIVAISPDNKTRTGVDKGPEDDSAKLIPQGEKTETDMGREDHKNLNIFD